MKEIRTFIEANAELAQYVPNTKVKGDYTLDRMRQLMSFLGNPQNSLKIIHVAGTSGKTSTSYYAAALLQEAGFTVGLTVSPHVDEVNERVQINLIPMAEQDFCRELGVFLNLITKSQIKNLSYFEILIAFAFWEFKRQSVDYAVIEVGLGGHLDGTNVVDRTDKFCIITDIGLDHTDRLGKTLPEIANQKAGIIQSGNDVFCHQQSDEIMQVFKRRCDAVHANLHVLASIKSHDTYDFLPKFQNRNFELAQHAVQFLLQRDNYNQLTESQLTNTAHTLIPARMETFHYGHKTIILDGSHNAQKLQTLISSIKDRYPGKSIAALVSFSDGKSFRLDSSLKELTGLTKNIIFTSFQQGQDYAHGAVDPHKLAHLAKRNGIATIKVMPDPKAALKELLTQPDPLLVITGSFFLVHDLRPEVQKL